MDVIESRESWYKRRITFAYNKLPIEGRDVSVFQICRKASIGEETYKKYREYLEKVVMEFLEAR